MIRLCLPLIAIAVMGCTQRAKAPPAAIPPVASDCGAEHFQSYVGKTRTDAITAEIAGPTRQAGKWIRWISPGTAVTMDYRTDRLNVYLDEKGAITRIRCG